MIIRDNHTGIHCLISLPEIRNNIIYRNRWTGIFCELVAFGTNTAIEHNIVAENGYSGMVLARKSAVLVQNNVFIDNKQFGIFVDMDSKRSRIIYNCIFNNRRAFNPYAQVDKTNLSIDPGLPLQPQDGGFIARSAHALKGLGKDGADIGIMSEADIKRIFVDSDNDRIPDDKDRCPDLREDLDEYEDWDGCPDYDNDLDGIYDTDDRCPDKPEDSDGFEDQDGCPDSDNDKDGICDPWVMEKGQSNKYSAICTGSDRCPSEPETINGYNDEDGCPDTAPAGNGKAK
jgi:hypothetical protein